MFNWIWKTKACLRLPVKLTHISVTVLKFEVKKIMDKTVLGKGSKVQVVVLVVILFLAQDVIYTSRAYATISASVCLSVTEVHWVAVHAGNTAVAPASEVEVII